jgi:hypothetical protein
VFQNSSERNTSQHLLTFKAFQQWKLRCHGNTVRGVEFYKQTPAHKKLNHRGTELSGHKVQEEKLETTHILVGKSHS